jgi:hypothetical protein
MEEQCANYKGEHLSFHKECLVYQEHHHKANIALQNQEHFHQVPTRVASNPPLSRVRMSQSNSRDWLSLSASQTSQPSQQALQTPSKMVIFTANTGNSGATQRGILKRCLLSTKPKDNKRAINHERAVVLHQGKDSGKEEGLAGKAKTLVTIKSQRTRLCVLSRSTSRS